LKVERVTYSKALLIARDATPLDVEERIAEAESTTWQKVAQRAEAEEREREREEGEITVEGSEESVDVIVEAVLDARRQILALGGESATEERALQRIADRFVAVWEVPLGRAEWRKAWEKEVLLRHGGLCAVPGCTRAACHKHHIEFQQDDGPDVDWNCLGVCKFHHLLCIHGGRLTVRGRAGEYLVFTFLDSTLTPWAKFEMRGDDDVCRVEVGLAQAAH
jgi:hypothetical protein